MRVRDEAAGAGSGTAASAAGAAGAAPQALADYRMRVQRALDYARAHLDEAPGLADLAREAAFSPFHFHRIFAALTGETPAEHVRRLRLEKAAGLLRLRPELSVTRIGADCGFATPSAFARDFRKRFGTTPGAYRAGSAERPRRSRFLARLAAGKKKRESDNARTAWRIETFPARRLACVSHTGPYGSGVGRAWGALFAWAVPRGYAGKGAKLFGLSWDNPEVAEAGVLRYDACLEVPPDAEDRKGAVFFRDLAPLRCLALPYKGPEAGFSEAFRRLYGEALPLCGREAADFPVIERYLAPPKGFFRRVFDVELCLPLRD